MSELSSTMKTEARYLIEENSKEIALFCTKYISPDSTSNNFRVATLPLTDKEKQYIDFSQGSFLSELSSKTNISRYDVIEAKIKDNISEYYNSIQLNEELDNLDNIPIGFKKNFSDEKNNHMKGTSDAYMKELKFCIIRGETPLSTINSVNNSLDNRLNSLDKFIQSGSRQLNQYMILYEYLKRGYTRYIYLAIGECCDTCKSLHNQIFTIADAKVGVNLPPMHINCDCQTAILDNEGNIAALLLNDSLLKNNINLIGKITTFLDLTELIPGFSKITGAINAVLYFLRGDYVNADLSGTTMLPIAVWTIKDRRLTDKAKTVPDSGLSFGDFRSQEAGRYILNLDKYSNINNPVGKVYSAWNDTLPYTRIPILMLEESGFFGDAFFTRLSYMYYRQGVDITQLEVQQLDRIYEVEHFNKIGMISGGIDAAATISLNIAKNVVKATGKVADDVVEGAGKSIPKFPKDPGKPPTPDYEWRGPADKGSWYNPKTGESMRPDLNHPNPIKPHYDYKSSDGTWYRIFEDGTFEVKK